MTASSASMHPLDGWLADIIERTAGLTAQRTVEKGFSLHYATTAKIGSATQGKLPQLLSVSSSRTARPRCQRSKCTGSESRTLPTLGGRWGGAGTGCTSDIEAWIKAHPLGGKVSGA